MNLYAMSPSQKRGKIYLNGLLKGLRTYNLDKEAERNLEDGLICSISVSKRIKFI